MANRLDQAASAALIVTALIVSVSFVRREIAPRSAGSSTVQFVDDWQTLLEAGVRVGTNTAPVKVIEFTDFECSFCARYHGRLVELGVEYGDAIELIYIHAPLPQHRFAVPAARAAECALAQGRFAEMQVSLYAKQDSFGLRSWDKYAADANVASLASFSSCVADTTPLPRIDEGSAHFARLRLPGTPTFLVNGHRLTGGGPDSLRSLIDAELAKVRRTP